MNKAAYKVVLPVIDHFQSVTSPCFADENQNDFVLHYKVGERTTPKLGRLYAFATVPEAQLFAAGKSGARIMKGTAENIGHPKVVAGLAEDFGRFWKSHRKTYVPPPNVAVTQFLIESMPDWVFCRKAPQGTLTCSAFTPTELLEDYSHLGSGH